MLTIEQKTAIRAIKLGFFCLYPYPIEWNVKTSTIKLHIKSRAQLFAFIYMLSLNVLLFFGILYVLLPHVFILKRPNFNVIMLMIYLMAAGGIGLMGFCDWLWLLKHKTVLESVNQFLEMKKRMLFGKPI